MPVANYSLEWMFIASGKTSKNRKYKELVNYGNTFLSMTKTNSRQEGGDSLRLEIHIKSQVGEMKINLFCQVIFIHLHLPEKAK